uniref:DUF4806 domain-containing protein n=1 Tax=Anopheles farauti TaxID=69004 RepID=A0A182QK87_9DIPT
MPYFVVETSDGFGNKEQLAAPEAWVQFKGNQTFLCWPNVRNISTLNKLLADERSAPSMMWEKHECEILRRNILSLPLAAKVIEQNKSRTQGKASATKAFISTSVKHDKTPARKPSTPSPVKDTATGSIAVNPSLSGKVFHIANVDGSADPLGAKQPETTKRSSSKLFSDLRELIDKNNLEMDRKMTQGFYRLNKMLEAIKMKQRDPQSRKVSSTDQHAAQLFEEVTIKKVTSLEEMNELEERLKEEEYRKQVHHWIDCTVGYETNPEARMMIILDLLIDKDFLPNFSWTGVSRNGVKKYAFAEYPQVCRVFQYAGTTSNHRADLVFVSQFFMKKLKYALARAENYKAIRRSAPHAPFTKRKKYFADEHDYANESVGHLKISRVETATDIEGDESETASTSYGQMSISIEGIEYSPVEDYEEADYESIVGTKSPETPLETLFMSAEDESE